MKTDPVCGMDVAEDSKYQYEHAEQRYHFCSESCLQKFKADPGQYKSQASGDDHALYTCSMHPEVVQQGPGRCPKCGMFLELKKDA